MPWMTPYPDAGEDTGVTPDREATGTSRWQKAVGAVGLLVLLALIALRFGLAGGGQGPDQDAQVVNQQQDAGTGGDGAHVPPPWVPKH